MTDSSNVLNVDNIDKNQSQRFRAMSTAGYPKDRATPILQPKFIKDTNTTNMKDMRKVGIIHSDLKMPARQSLKVRHLQYATMTTDISEKEVEEDELCEWGLLNVDKKISKKERTSLYWRYSAIFSPSVCLR